MIYLLWKFSISIILIYDLFVVKSYLCHEGIQHIFCPSCQFFIHLYGNRMFWIISWVYLGVFFFLDKSYLWVLSCLSSQYMISNFDCNYVVVYCRSVVESKDDNTITQDLNDHMVWKKIIDNLNWNSSLWFLKATSFPFEV
jgi:hypothetical protein